MRDELIKLMYATGPLLAVAPTVRLTVGATLEILDSGPVTGNRVLIVDRYPVLSEGLSLRLADLPDVEVLPGSTSVDDLDEQLASQTPDIVVLDANLDGQIGQLIEHLRAAPCHPAIVLVASDDNALTEDAMRAGVSACVRKDASIDELFAAIRWVQRGDMWISPALLSRLLVDEERRLADDTGGIDQLTVREVEILKLLMQGKGHKEVAEALHIAINTVRTHTRNIQLKLHVHSSVAAVSVALDRGIRPRPISPVH